MKLRLRLRQKPESFGRLRSLWAVAAALTVAVVAAACAPPKPPPPPPPTVPPGSTVYLTFDDGPSVYTPQILSELNAEGVPATFFVLGQNAVQHPGTVEQAHADGHAIGNHSWSHPDLTTLLPQQVQTELQSTSDEIANLTGAPPILWRPPFGAFNSIVTQVASSLGLSMRLWDVNPSDFDRPGVDSIVSQVVNTVSPGAIVLLHDGSPGDNEDRSQTAAAVPIIIDTLQSLGYSFGALATTSGASTGPTGPSVVIGRE
jgi:peptidoglycan-N-acetylglucosamine deacetylase